MTRFRMPCGWATRREEGKRPSLADTWLDPDIVEDAVASVSVRYWRKLHWATPPWITRGMIKRMRAIYLKAKPGLEHVDHIVPLKHPLVCGLHVPWNLQVLPGRENLTKSNNYWPDCPDHLCPEKNLPADMFGEGEPHQTRLPL